MKEVLITSSILILVMVAARQIFRGKVKHSLIYGMWLLVALRLLIPVQFGAFRFSFLTTAQPLTQAITEVTQNPVVGPSRQEIYQSIEQIYVRQGQPLTAPEVRQAIQSQAERTITAPTIGQVLTVLWLVGAGCMAIWFALVNLRLHRRLRRDAVAPEEIDSPIPVLVSARVSSPCLVGLLHPVIYLTPESSQSHNLTHVLTHELTHYRHKDHLWALLRCVCLCLYWFHPLVWLAAFLSRRDCELACDEGALKILGEHQRIAYGKTLLKIVSHAQTRGHLLQTATTMNESKRQLKERVNYIVKKPKVWITAAIAMVLVCAICFGCAISGGSPDTPENTDHTPTSAIPTASSTTPTEPPTEPDDDPSGISLTEEQIQLVNETFASWVYDESRGVPFKRPVVASSFAHGYYQQPDLLDLNKFLYHFPYYTEAKGAERSAAAEGIGQNFAGHCKKIDRTLLDQELMRWMGISSQELYRGATLDMVYLDAYNAYYCFTGSVSNGGISFECVRGQIMGDTAYLFSENDVLTMIRQEDQWYVYSYMPIGAGPMENSVILTTEEVQMVNAAFAQDIEYLDESEEEWTIRPVSRFFTSVYSCPQEMSLYDFVKNFPGMEYATEEEQAALKEVLGEDMFQPHRVERELVDEVLWAHMRITSQELYHGPISHFVYLEAFDSYYSTPGGYHPGNFQCIGGEIIGNTAYLYSPNTVLTLVKQDETWYIYSHQTIEEFASSSEPDQSASLTEEQLDQANLEIRTMSSTNVHLFFYLYYTHPQGLDLDAFLQIYPDRTRATAQEQSLAETYIHNIRGETCYRFDKSVIDSDLSRWLGTTSDALYHGPTQNLVYLEEYQAYFYFGYQALGYFTCTGGSIQGDTVHLYNDKQKVELVQRNGEWQFVSSLPASVTISPEETLLSAEQLYPARITFVSEAYTKNGDAIGVTATPESCLFMSYYSSPEELDLSQFLRNSPDFTAATPEEEQAAMALLGLSGDRSPSPCHKFSKSQVDELLMKWYGITSDGLYQGPSFDLVYVEAYDAYYNFTSDFAAGVFQCIGGTISGDTAYLYSIHGKLTLERVGETWYIRAYEPISTSNA